MSSKKEQERSIVENDFKRADKSNVEYDVRGELRTGVQEQNRAVERTFNETRDNIKRAVDEARTQIPRNTQAINDYQEHNLQATREVADSYLESQKEIIHSFQSTYLPLFENAYKSFWSNFVSPRRAAEIYTRMVSNYAENVMTTNRLANNALIANIEVHRAFVQREKEDIKQFSRMSANTAKTFENNSKDFTHNQLA